MHTPIKSNAQGMLGGETLGGETKKTQTRESFARYCSTSTAPVQAPSLTFFRDGLYEPANPGIWATWAWEVTTAAGDEIASGRGRLGRGAGISNNLSEYTAALQATDWAAAHGHRNVLLRADSRLMVEQAAGRWACNAEHLRPLRDELRSRLKNVQS